MFLQWLDKSITALDQLLWYIGLVPPPTSPGSKQSNIKTAPLKIPPLPKPVADKRKPDFFALVIGIDEYKYINPLKGCVADAHDMIDYLTKTLGVPSSHIKTLYNEQATRRAIKTNISALASDDRIRPGDPIVIFFAGHGTKAKPPPRWEAGGPAPVSTAGNPNAADQTRIQMILPVDFKRETNGEEHWQGILDITLASLLSHLAMAKGNNITVIHDCCHSGSSTRNDDDSQNQDERSRGIELAKDYAILSSVNNDTLQGGLRTSTVSTGFQKTAMDSHVLLAACSESMKALEVIDPNGQTRGSFTRELLSFLRSPTVQGSAITYTELIERLPDLPRA